MKLLAVLAMALMFQHGSSKHPVISDTVAPLEYQLYSLWVDRNFGPAYAGNLYLLDQSKAVNPQAISCPNPSRHNPDAYLYEELHALGEKTSPLLLKENLQGMTRFSVASTAPDTSDKVSVQFSRVAFSDDKNSALFVVVEKQKGRSDKTTLMFALQGR